jgi:hypothetical protein
MLEVKSEKMVKYYFPKSFLDDLGGVKKLHLLVGPSVGPHNEILAYVEIASPQDPRACFGLPLLNNIFMCHIN